MYVLFQLRVVFLDLLDGFVPSLRSLANEPALAAYRSMGYVFHLAMPAVVW